VFPLAFRLRRFVRTYGRKGMCGFEVHPLGAKGEGDAESNLGRHTNRIS
jgi:hypothetical protein